MAITNATVRQGPFFATGSAQTISYAFMTLTDAEIEVYYDDVSGRVVLSKDSYIVARNMERGVPQEGGQVTVKAGAAPVGVALYVRAAPLWTRNIHWSNSGSRLQSLNEEQDRDALRNLRLRNDVAESNALSILANTTSQQALAAAEDARTAAELSARGFFPVDKPADLAGLKSADLAYVRGSASGDVRYGGFFRWRAGDFSAQVASDPRGAIWVAGDGGAWERVRSGVASLHWWGSDLDALAAMANTVGFVCIPEGGFSVGGNVTIGAPLYFETGGYLTAAAGVTVRIENVIEAPKQWVLRGAGSYSLGHNASTYVGENARQVHVSWFGAFPRGVTGDDAAPFIQKAIDAMGNSREGVILHDVGNYEIESPLLLNRGVELRGEGDRRTVYKTNKDGFDLITTAGDAVRIDGIQFECHLGILPIRNSPWVVVNHNSARIHRSFMGQSNQGVVVNGLDCHITTLQAAYGSACAAGSSLIDVRAGSAYINNIRLPSSAFGPEDIVRVRPSATVSDLKIKDVHYVTPSVGVSLDASAASVTRAVVDGVTYNGSVGAVPAVVKLAATGSHTLREILVSEVVSTSNADTVVTIDHTSTGLSSGIVLSKIVTQGAKVAGLKITRTTGTLGKVRVADDCDLSKCAVPIQRSGNMDLIVSPSVTATAQPAATQLYTIPDDSVVVIPLGRSVFTGMVMASVGNQFLIAQIRAASGPTVSSINASATCAVTTGALTGTTGTDGNFTLSVTDGNIYLENRQGGSRTVSFTLLTGSL